MGQWVLSMIQHALVLVGDGDLAAESPTDVRTTVIAVTMIMVIP